MLRLGRGEKSNFIIIREERVCQSASSICHVRSWKAFILNVVGIDIKILKYQLSGSELMHHAVLILSLGKCHLLLQTLRVRSCAASKRAFYAVSKPVLCILEPTLSLSHDKEVQVCTGSSVRALLTAPYSGWLPLQVPPSCSSCHPLSPAPPVPYTQESL